MSVVINGSSGITFPDSVTQTEGIVLTGGVGFFAMNTAPTGWLKANGAAISRTTYAALFAAIGTTFGTGDGSSTFNLPDMRGYFPRGWADNGSVDSGRTFGSTQTDAMQGHKHTQSLGGSISTVANVAGTYVIGNSNTSVVSDPISDGVNGVPRTASETRPINLALLACIKY